MRLSVVICTRHRPDSLARVLYSLRDCEAAFDPGDWEVLVVDNGDVAGGADACVRAEFDALPLRVVHEPRAGLSHARNRGVTAGRGEWLLWTDDDITVSATWLSAYRHAMDAFPDARVLGGPIHPSFEGCPPEWLTDGQEHIRSAFASRHANDVDDPFRAAGPLPYGANFAIHRADALRFPFDPDLGRHPNRPTRGWEEVFVIQNILAGDGQGRWLREAAVTHHIDASRQTAAFIRAYYYDVGYVAAMQTAHRVPPRRAAVKLARAVLWGLRFETGLGLQDVAPAPPGRAQRLRGAGQSWGDARAWLTALLDADTVAVWREKGGV